MTHNELITIDSYCELSKTVLIFKREVSKDEWQTVFNALNLIEGCVQFWIGDCLKYREQKWGMYDDVVEETGKSKQTLKDIKWVSEKVSCRQDDLSFEHHKQVASLEPLKQKEVHQRASEEKLTVRELRAEVRKEKYKDVEFPEGKYQVIYADPPWSYNDKCEAGAIQSGGAIKHYPVMSIQELCELPVCELVNENAVLFLWVTSPLLEESFRVINAWGFKYKTSFIWDKIKHNMGHYNSVRHEFLLICTRGSCTPDNIKLFDSVQTIEKNGHSEKPEEFRNIIDTIYTGKKIELFARNNIENWDAYGNEL